MYPASSRPPADEDGASLLLVAVGVASFNPRRDRVVPFWELSPKGVFIALGPAIMLTILFYFDHNVSSLLSQKQEFHLQKPPAYHWDFFIVGVLGETTHVLDKVLFSHKPLLWA